MTDDDRFFDALLEERRGQLGPAERLELEAALEGSLDLRLAMQAHRGFEELGAYEPRDDERCEDIAARVRGRLGWPGRRVGRSSFRRRAQSAVLAVVFCAGAAAAGVAIWKLVSNGGSTDRVVPPARVVRHVVEPAHSSAPATEPKSTPATDEPTAGTEIDASPSQPKAQPPAPPKLSDEQLFVRATELKGNGNWPSARALYERLLLEYPHSKYAASSVMTLGKSDLVQGNADRALHWFRRYQVLKGPLVAEAMWGEAEALGRLGRMQERAKVQAGLSKRFPLSPYASKVIVE